MFQRKIIGPIVTHKIEKHTRRQRAPSLQLNRGFSLIEGVIAVTLLIIAMLGPVTLAARSIYAARESQQEIVASYLAQEAIEVVHSYRGNNSSRDYGTNSRTLWKANLISPCNTGEGCIIDVMDTLSSASGSIWGPNVFVPCPGGSCAGSDWVYYNTATGFYRQSNPPPSGSSWIRTPLRRNIFIEEVVPDRQARVYVRVFYPGFGGERTFQVIDEIYNWFPGF